MWSGCCTDTLILLDGCYWSHYCCKQLTVCLFLAHLPQIYTFKLHWSVVFFIYLFLSTGCVDLESHWMESIKVPLRWHERIPLIYWHRLYIGTLLLIPLLTTPFLSTPLGNVTWKWSTNPKSSTKDTAVALTSLSHWMTRSPSLPQWSTLTRGLSIRH